MFIVKRIFNKNLQIPLYRTYTVNSKIIEVTKDDTGNYDYFNYMK